MRISAGFPLLLLSLFAACFLFWSCDYGQLGGADKTDTYYPGDALFEERLEFFSGVWYSHNSEKRSDGYRIRKWSGLTVADREKVQDLFPSVDADNLKTYSTQDFPQGSDAYVLLYDDTVFGQKDDDTGGQESWGFGYLGMVRAVNIFNGNKKRGAIIIEYFEGADPLWLSGEGLAPGEKPFFGIYFRVIDTDNVQMANSVDLAELYKANLYHTEQKTLLQAIKFFDVENEAEFISWGVVIPQSRE